jgi:hypothetical protein
VAWFRCLVRGENFPGEVIDQAGPVGFYVTRFIEATSADDAESRVLEALRKDPRLALPANLKPAGNTRVYFEETGEVAADQVLSVEQGFAWYPMGPDAE